MKSFLVAFALCLAAALPAWASNADTEQSNQHHHEQVYDLPLNDLFRKPDDGDLVTRTIKLNIIETETGYMLFEPDAIPINHGSVVRFLIKNGGELDHEFFLGSFDQVAEHHQWMLKNPDMEHDDPNGISLPSGETVEVVWKFPEMVNLEFGCLIPGHLEAGMWGVIMVHDHLAH
ncbi:copper oxidase [Sulfitobacter sp. SK012]|uniref:cupredoxin domain-containing protein n=1 Tax=Sulfitobacter sp. SK012 TaxID=1389005 RepID=UPI000E0AAE5F|nr:copper oxidase [Sulfitobacter sp. SK012]AXI47919.1 copper oxidase [Sulfitobacter sp. SK012]